MDLDGEDRAGEPEFEASCVAAVMKVCIDDVDARLKPNNRQHGDAGVEVSLNEEQKENNTHRCSLCI